MSSPSLFSSAGDECPLWVESGPSCAVGPMAPIGGKRTFELASQLQIKTFRRRDQWPPATISSISISASATAKKSAK